MWSVLERLYFYVGVSNPVSVGYAIYANSYVVSFILRVLTNFMAILPYSGKVWRIDEHLTIERFGKLIVNRSPYRLLIVSTNLGGFSLANHRRFAKFIKLSPTKLSCYTVSEILSIPSKFFQLMDCMRLLYMCVTYVVDKLQNNRNNAPVSLLFKPGRPINGRYTPGFLKLVLYGKLVCVCVWFLGC